MPQNMEQRYLPLKLCENHFNTKAVVLIENGAADYLVTNESKERFYAEMNEAKLIGIFMIAGTPHGFALPPTLVSDICMKVLTGVLP